VPEYIKLYREENVKIYEEKINQKREFEDFSTKMSSLLLRNPEVIGDARRINIGIRFGPYTS
jgi:hypothetical protein